MSDASPALDEAFDRLATSDFELPNGFVNHGPMACEALAALGCGERIDGSRPGQAGRSRPARIPGERRSRVHGRRQKGGPPILTTPGFS
jgi:hypothetical protein